MKQVLDHVGIAVENLDQAIADYQSKFGFKLDLREAVPTQKVEIAFLKLENTKLELLMPTSSDSTLRKFLDTRGPGLHHICYQVDDIVAELKRLKNQGLKLIDENPRPGAHNTLIAFLHPKSTGSVLTELCQYK